MLLNFLKFKILQNIGSSTWQMSWLYDRRQQKEKGFVNIIQYFAPFDSYYKCKHLKYSFHLQLYNLQIYYKHLKIIYLVIQAPGIKSHGTLQGKLCMTSADRFSKNLTWKRETKDKPVWVHSKNVQLEPVARACMHVVPCPSSVSFDFALWNSAQSLCDDSTLRIN